MKLFKGFLYICALSFFFGFVYNKPITNQQLIVFEGSDWCINCRKFEKNILKDSLFIDFVRQNEIRIEKVDFPQRKKLTKAERKYNEEMADKYQFDGNFPTIVLARIDNSKYDKLYFRDQSVDEMIDQIQEKMKALK